MIKFTIQGVRPFLANGRLQSLSFELVAEDGGIRDAQTGTYPASMPERDAPYTDADFAAKCDEIAESAGLKGALTQRIEERKSRVVAEPIRVEVQLTESEQRVAWVNQVDDTIDVILRRHTRFQMGYTEREAAAAAYKASGYAGTPSDWVTRFADNVGMPYPAAADLILSQAAKLRAALKELDNELRMDKYLIARAGSLEQAKAEFDRIIGEALLIAKDLQ